MVGDHFLSCKNLDQSHLESLLELAGRLEHEWDRGNRNQDLLGKIMASMFFEPSTRTRMSFETAMLRLGGQVISVADAQSSSTQKGETLEDTGRMLNHYADVAVIRHPRPNSAHSLARFAKIPVINAGDGDGEHPSQALLDMYTIFAKRARFDGLHIALVGDLLNGRTVHSLIHLLATYQVTVYLVSPKALRFPADHLPDALRDKVYESDDLSQLIEQLDVIYMTRVQEERFDSDDAYQSVRGSYCLQARDLRKFRKDGMILHPLPRVDEISTDVDELVQAYYFEQAKKGVFARMALLKTLCSSC